MTYIINSGKNRRKLPSPKLFRSCIMLTSLASRLGKNRRSNQFRDSMPKRKAAPTEDEAVTPPASAEFSSLVAKFSYSEAALDDLATKSSSPRVIPLVTTSKSSRAKKARAPSTSPIKSSSKSRRNPGYAPPSAYSHLPTPDLDRVAYNLILLFIGLNPGSSVPPRS